MSQIIQDIIHLIWSTPLAFLRGSFRIIRSGSGTMMDFWARLGPGWLFLVVSLAVTILGGWPWFSYAIQFDELEVYGVRSRLWTFFTFAGFLGMLICLLQFPLRRLAFWVVSVLALILWTVGILWPELHVRFHPDTSYSILLAHWIYPGSLAVSILTSFLLPGNAGWDILQSYRNLNQKPDPLPEPISGP